MSEADDLTHDERPLPDAVSADLIARIRERVGGEFWRARAVHKPDCGIHSRCFCDCDFEVVEVALGGGASLQRRR